MSCDHEVARIEHSRANPLEVWISCPESRGGCGGYWELGGSLEDEEVWIDREDGS